MKTRPAISSEFSMKLKPNSKSAQAPRKAAAKAPAKKAN
jgi:hypothetical protein